MNARYQEVCRGCGGYTQPRNGKGDAYAYWNPGALERRWSRARVYWMRQRMRQLVVRAMREWRARCGRLPSSYDWLRTHARRRGGEALERLGGGEWPRAWEPPFDAAGNAWLTAR